MGRDEVLRHSEAIPHDITAVLLYGGADAVQFEVRNHEGEQPASRAPLPKRIGDALHPVRKFFLENTSQLEVTCGEGDRPKPCEPLALQGRNPLRRRKTGPTGLACVALNRHPAQITKKVDLNLSGM